MRSLIYPKLKKLTQASAKHFYNFSKPKAQLNAQPKCRPRFRSILLHDGSPIWRDFLNSYCELKRMLYTKQMPTLLYVYIF